MKTNFQPTGDLTDEQLLERERTLRIMASTALTTEELATLLALAERYEAVLTERQRPAERKSG